MSRTDRIQQEARGLWIEVFGEPPSEDLDGDQMLNIIFQRTPPSTYSRLGAAQRSRNLVWPRKR
ncbi:MAG: hypothetical protein Q8M88_01500 [Phenylobacterium sp.]|uniref:hypothetical protein n=1 Tax=Phenylobacterium sp. TaxID=1871053 RepID=UPI0027363291|nr:hypothetical protein [Phenylobacterium sp.]MDP3173093.1 hypothetical protein [Phenylobacterium sp.]